MSRREKYINWTLARVIAIIVIAVISAAWTINGSIVNWEHRLTIVEQAIIDLRKDQHQKGNTE